MEEMFEFTKNALERESAHHTVYLILPHSDFFVRIPTGFRMSGECKGQVRFCDGSHHQEILPRNGNCFDGCRNACGHGPSRLFVRWTIQIIGEHLVKRVDKCLDHHDAIFRTLII